MLEFDAGVLGRELPVSFGMRGIAVSLPCGELVQEDLLVGDAAVETLRRENGEFGFRHIEPTAVLWRVSMPLCANFPGRPHLAKAGKGQPKKWRVLLCPATAQCHRSVADNCSAAYIEISIRIEKDFIECIFRLRSARRG